MGSTQIYQKYHILLKHSNDTVKKHKNKTSLNCKKNKELITYNVNFFHVKLYT